MHERLLGGFTLGEYHVDPGTGWVAGPAGRVHLAPRLLRTLLCLAARAPDIVPRDELIRFVWGEDSAGHERLSHTIGELRRMLHDDAGEPRFIETQPMRGYRLIVTPSVGRAEPTANAAHIESAPAPTSAGLFSQLRDRGVLETALTYLVAGWLLIQISAVTFVQLGLPDTAATFTTYLVIVGFPIAVVIAWFIELTPSGPVLDRESGTRRRRPALSRKYISIVSALALASVAVFLVQRYVGLPSGFSRLDAAMIDSDVDPNSIAVLPFANLTGTADGQTLSLGLAEGIRNALGRVPRLSVSSRVDSFSLAPNTTSEIVRSRLGVPYYLEGSVQDFGTGGRVSVNLVDSSSGRSRLTREFQYQRQDFSDFIALQDVIAKEAIAYLRLALPEETQTTEIPRDTPGRDAYLSYRRGIMALYKPTTAETVNEAIAHFRNALSIYPGYAAAHAGICRAYAQGYAQINDATLIERADSACDSALADTADLDIVHTARGDLYRSTGNLQEAKRAYEQARAINPSSVDAAIGLARVYAGLRDDAAAEAAFLDAIELQPPGYWRAHSELGRFYFSRGRFGEAARQYRKIVEIDRENLDGWNNLGSALVQSGAFDAAIDAFRNAFEIEPTAATYRSFGMVYYYRGDFSLAEAQFRAAIDLDPDDHIARSNLGDALTAAGDESGAREAFERARQLAMRRLEVNPRDYLTEMDLAWIDVALGDFEAADALLDTALASAPSDPYVHYIRSLAATRRGDESAALESLRVAIELGYPRVLLGREPHLASLRDDPEFEALIGDPSR